MKDRVPTKVLPNGAIRYGIYDEGGELIRYEWIKKEDEPIVEGMKFNKVNVLPDEIVDLLGIDSEDPNVADAFEKIANRQSESRNELSEHVGDKDNPHSVTAEQLGLDGIGSVLQMHVTNLNNPHEVTKSQVGLGVVPNEDWKAANLAVTANTGTNGTVDTAERTGTLISLFNWLRQKINWILGENGLGGKQEKLVSGTNIKTFNNESILGSGNIDVSGSSEDMPTWITSGSANAYIVNPSPAVEAYQHGQKFRIKVHAANTSATVNINFSGLGNKLVSRFGTTGPLAGQMALNAVLDIEYDSALDRIVIIGGASPSGASALPMANGGTGSTSTTALMRVSGVNFSGNVQAYSTDRADSATSRAIRNIGVHPNSGTVYPSTSWIRMTREA